MTSSLPQAIDHVAFAARNLEDVEVVLAERGLSHTAYGECRWLGPNNELRARCLSVILADGYLDIIESESAVEVLRPSGVLLRTDEIGLVRRRLMEEGVRCARPYEITRHFTNGKHDQRYEVFGIDVPHASGLSQGIIATALCEPMENLGKHTAGVTSVVVAAAILGVEL